MINSKSKLHGGSTVWHYQSRCRRYVTILQDGSRHEEELYELVEVFPDMKVKDPNIPAHTNDAVTVCGDSKTSLATWLRIAAIDVEKYPVIDGGTETKDLRES